MIANNSFSYSVYLGIISSPGIFYLSDKNTPEMNLPGVCVIGRVLLRGFFAVFYLLFKEHLFFTFSPLRNMRGIRESPPFTVVASIVLLHLLPPFFRIFYIANIILKIMICQFFIDKLCKK